MKASLLSSHFVDEETSRERLNHVLSHAANKGWYWAQKRQSTPVLHLNHSFQKVRRMGMCDTFILWEIKV